jgi:hypothetical protein
MKSTNVFAVAMALAAQALSGVVDAAAAVPVVSPTASDAATTDIAKLKDLVAGLDRAMFDAYNAHDVDGLMAWFAEDLEFYHDTGGLLDFQQVKAGFTSVFASNKDIRRELVEGSLEVYPIKNYGAIEIGAHRFCHTENGKADCGTFQFTQIWRLKDGAWKVAREVSYGH